MKFTKNLMKRNNIAKKNKCYKVANILFAAILKEGCSEKILRSDGIDPYYDIAYLICDGNEVGIPIPLLNSKIALSFYDELILSEDNYPQNFSGEDIDENKWADTIGINMLKDVNSCDLAQEYLNINVEEELVLNFLKSNIQQQRTKNRIAALLRVARQKDVNPGTIREVFNQLVVEGGNQLSIYYISNSAARDVKDQYKKYLNNIDHYEGDYRDPPYLEIGIKAKLTVYHDDGKQEEIETDLQHLSFKVLYLALDKGRWYTLRKGGNCKKWSRSFKLPVKTRKQIFQDWKGIPNPDGVGPMFIQMLEEHLDAFIS